ncbi:hypothetical protein PanWU01x14_066980 [Parasponia andersonii]|uniref:Uncharacterized protein n=1 Tax=Parasponia andersonii TaxID=3476 RepID=A0A2P5DGB0_PARAD|nr:hypothetical protein PanWU01x14_066980 [Parasponia andersonii]
MRSFAVTRRRRRTSTSCGCHEPPPTAGKISAGKSRHRDGFSPIVPPPDVRSPHHCHRSIRIGSTFVFQSLSASNSAPVRSCLL